MKTFSDSSILLRKYSSEWIKKKKISNELYQLLKRHKIKNKCDTLIVVNNLEIIRLFAQAILRYNSFVQFLFPTEIVIVSVTDHMDIFVSAKNNSVLQKVHSAVAKLNDKSKKIVFRYENVK